MVAVTNEMDLGDHALGQKSVGNRYPVSVSISVTADSSPPGALGEATATPRKAGIAQDGDRRTVRRDHPLVDGIRVDDDVRLAHFGIVGATQRDTGELYVIDALARICGPLWSSRETCGRPTGRSRFSSAVTASPSVRRSTEGATPARSGTSRPPSGSGFGVGVGQRPTARGARTAAKPALGRRQDDAWGEPSVRAGTER